MPSPVYLSAMGIVCSLGSEHRHILANLLDGNRDAMVQDSNLFPDNASRYGRVHSQLPALP